MGYSTYILVPVIHEKLAPVTHNTKITPSKQ